jgi:hypothetical protein
VRCVAAISASAHTALNGLGVVHGGRCLRERSGAGDAGEYEGAGDGIPRRGTHSESRWPIPSPRKRNFWCCGYCMTSRPACAAQAYGTQGQAQYGIDILVRLTDGTFEVWQTKRYKAFTSSAVGEAVRLFLKPQVGGSGPKVRARRRLRARCQRSGGGDRGSPRLRTQPETVDDFFDRPWVHAVCPREAIERLATRLFRPRRQVLRKALHAGGDRLSLDGLRSTTCID